MAKLKLVKDINGKDFVVGVVVHAQGGFVFLPKIIGRKPSRKIWKTATGCIPKWAFDMADRIETIEDQEVA